MKIGIDLGGSHIAIGVISDNENIIEKYEIDINSQENKKEFIESVIVKQVSKFYDKYNIEKIGIAVPGIVKNQKITNLFNLGIGKYDLVSKLRYLISNNLKIEEDELCDINIKNDGVCAAVAEVKFGSLKSYSKSVFICLGTGIGGAICENGFVNPSNEIVGFEFGHMQIEKQKKTICKCGKINCFELYGSIKKLKKDLQQELNLNLLNGKELHDEILKNIDNITVQEIIDNYINEVVCGICKISNIIKPEAICLGGGFSYYSDILFDKLVLNFNNSKYLDKNIKVPKIIKSKYKNDSGIIGAIY